MAGYPTGGVRYELRTPTVRDRYSVAGISYGLRHSATGRGGWVTAHRRYPSALYQAADDGILASWVAI